MKRPASATGTFPKPIASSPGATCGRSTVPRRSSSRLIAPLYKGKSAHELLALFLGEPDRSGLEIVRDYWKRQALPGDFELVWRTALEAGFIAGTAFKPKQVTPAVRARLSGHRRLDDGPESLEIVFRPDPTVWDGRFANNGWLQELPKPLSKLSWDNAAFLSPALARGSSSRTKTWSSCGITGARCGFPSWIMPGQADQSITVSLGHGRPRAGRVGTGVGVDVYGLRTLGGTLVRSRSRGRQDRRAPPAGGHAPPFQHGGSRPDSRGHSGRVPCEPRLRRRPSTKPVIALSLIDEPSPQARHEQGEGNAWGMAIDLNTCIGCGACVVACQAENNIPVVGREQVLASREMHWIRIDRYFEGEDTSNPKVDFQPVPCMHCEKAPCEVVCPVGATTHSAEGLNEMTYNRCVGTRYCSNNCPYKVRRFNFLHYTDDTSPSLEIDAKPRCDRAVAGGHGKVHVLRPADQRRADQRRDRESVRLGATRS